jgi:hypothetical protein
MQITARGWKIFGGCIVLVLALMVWGSRQPDPSAGVGEHSILFRQGNKQVPFAATVTGFDAMTTAFVAHDTVGLSQLMGAGAVWFVPNGTQVLVIDMGMYRRQVRFESGEFAGQAGWVSSDYIIAR